VEKASQRFQLEGIIAESPQLSDLLAIAKPGNRIFLYELGPNETDWDVCPGGIAIRNGTGIFTIGVTESEKKWSFDGSSEQWRFLRRGLVTGSNYGICAGEFIFWSQPFDHWFPFMDSLGEGIIVQQGMDFFSTDGVTTEKIDVDFRGGDAWYPLTRNQVMILRCDEFLINGRHPVYKGNNYGDWHGRVIQIGDGLFADGKDLIFRGEMMNWRTCIDGKGVVVQQGNSLTLVVYEFPPFL